MKRVAGQRYDFDDIGRGATSTTTSSSTSSVDILAFKGEMKWSEQSYERMMNAKQANAVMYLCLIH